MSKNLVYHNAPRVFEHHRANNLYNCINLAKNHIITYVIGDSNGIYEIKESNEGEYYYYLVIERVFNKNNIIQGHITSIYLDKDYGENLYYYELENFLTKFNRIKKENNSWKYSVETNKLNEKGINYSIYINIKKTCDNLNAKFPSVLPIFERKNKFKILSSKGIDIKENITMYEMINVVAFININGGCSGSLLMNY